MVILHTNSTLLLQLTETISANITAFGAKDCTGYEDATRQAYPAVEFITGKRFSEDFEIAKKCRVHFVYVLLLLETTYSYA